MHFVAVAQAKTALQSAEGVIVVIKQNAMININGITYLISKENSAYTQFEKRHIKMYDVHLDYINGNLIIDFKGFRFIDAFV
jgi:phage gp45-like